MEVTSTQPLDEDFVTVVAEFFPAEAEGRRGSSVDGPAIGACVVIKHVLIHRDPVADMQIAAHCFSDRTLRRWEHNILIENI
jgi:hypothetical protein